MQPSSIQSRNTNSVYKRVLPMKTWRRPSFAILSLLAMLLTWLPQIAWSCPMTGRIGAADKICYATQTSEASAPQQCTRKAKSPVKAPECCKAHQTGASQPASESATQSQRTQNTCANPQGDCCQLVRVPGSPKPTTPPSIERATVHHQVALLVAPIVPPVADALHSQQIEVPAALTFNSTATEHPLRTQHLSPVLQGRAPPLS